jgi:hypothetical protein
MKISTFSLRKARSPAIGAKPQGSNVYRELFLVDAGEAREARLLSAGIEAPIKQGADRDSTVSQPVGGFM